MAKHEVISVFCFGEEIGRLGFDEKQLKSSFQFHPEFLEKSSYKNLFPPTGILKRIPQTQVFTQFNTDTFRGVPPMIADSLPDYFGNIIFKKWLELNDKNFRQISVVEQLAYVGSRGMGALEYRPSKTLPQATNLDLSEIITLLTKVLDAKQAIHENALNHEAMLNIFKMGSSAGGARPKVLIAENSVTGEIIPGDVTYSSEYNHYLVKLALDEEQLGYSREKIEYCYYETAVHLGISMMPSKLIDNKHFATLRFDRVNGQKKHVLTATGLTGWDFQDPMHSSYENLFELAVFLRIPHNEIEALFKRMVFNVVFCNSDDHLKNHTFIYNDIRDNWNLAPAYDLTYSLNPLLNYKKALRALSINTKRTEISRKDIFVIAEKYTIKNPDAVINEVIQGIPFWKEKMVQQQLPKHIMDSIVKDFVQL
jgi:serine/threonine-protein kinase HipA